MALLIPVKFGKCAIPIIGEFEFGDNIILCGFLSLYAPGEKNGGFRIEIHNRLFKGGTILQAEFGALRIEGAAYRASEFIRIPIPQVDPADGADKLSFRNLHLTMRTHIFHSSKFPRQKLVIKQDNKFLLFLSSNRIRTILHSPSPTQEKKVDLKQ
jgi:hypothetical protein